MFFKSFFSGPGFEDVTSSLKAVRLPLFLAWADIRQRYRRSALGPFWITISTGVMICCIGVIFGNLFKAPMKDFLPFLTVGLILWAFFSSVIVESTQVFVNSEAIIRQLPIPLYTHIVRMIGRNVIILFHNILIIPLVCIAVQHPVNMNLLWVIPAVIIFVLNMSWLALVLGIVCTRFRDMSQIVASILQVLFYITPIIWMPSLLPAKTENMVLAPNPLYHLMEIVRAPILGSTPSLINWTVSLLLFATGSFFAVLAFNYFRNKIVYWL